MINNNHLGSRRHFLSDMGMGFTGLALGAMLERDAAAEGGMTPGNVGIAHFPAKAKSVIWLFMIGGTTHLESFDPKPELSKYAGMSIAETPYKDVLTSPYSRENLRAAANDNRVELKVLPMQTGFRKHGQSGAEISDWWPHVARHADDLAIVRSLWTTDNNHGAQLQFHTGRHRLEGFLPTIGSWIHYGLGSLNENLPQFIVLGEPVADCCGGVRTHGAGYLGPEHAGVMLDVAGRDPLPFASPGSDVYHREQREQFELLNRLNRESVIEYPDDTQTRARIKAYELAFRMQTAVPDVVDFGQETQETQNLYGLDQDVTRPFGRICLSARRLVERGVRFIQVFHGANGAAGKWDAHFNLVGETAPLCRQVDQPIAALLHDLKRRGMLDETLVVWCTEFGRTPGAEQRKTVGRNHHPYGFSAWMAGGGLKGGVVHGATDELGYHAVEDRHYVTDLHATVLHQLGLQPRQMKIPGRKRLEIEYGKPIRELVV